ncbi:MAG: hypothetical protein CVU65_16425 [Deltaproteobacteria bacterium HGW-Deltaproteobacteria-22]|nr:MAG: hypothetical protein CVU65_16425 [Deltaproteobacteria bacterium HGW-Deltaproteobacteria-22]
MFSTASAQSKLSADEIKKTVENAMAKKTPKVEITTSVGTITVQLDAVKAPITVRNFLTYVVEEHYTKTVFHRVISEFMIQGGGFTEDRKEKLDTLHAAIRNEANNGLSNLRGTIAMARTQVVDSARAQFFINTVDNQRLNYKGPGLQYGYCVFGKVISGMEVVDKIRKLSIKNLGGAFVSWPVPVPVITGMKIVD